MILFQTMPFWNVFHVPYDKLKTRFEYFFGKEKRMIEDRKNALLLLSNITNTIQKEMIIKIEKESTYAFLLKLYCIFDEVHSLYLKEKEVRSKLVEKNIDIQGKINTLIDNRNIMRCIIDACNIWIENCVLYQHDLNEKNIDLRNDFILDYDLLIDLYLYGFSSYSISLLKLSEKIDFKNSYYGLEISPCSNIPAEVLKYHPYIYFNTALVGNQNSLDDGSFTVHTNDTAFGKGFYDESKVPFLCFLAAIVSLQKCELQGNDKSLRIIGKQDFISRIEECTKPKIDGKYYYNNFVLTRDKIKQHLREKENIIWVIGVNKFRHEIKPFIGLDDENVLFSYGALEQAKHLWISYFNNGGMCYTSEQDNITKAMEKRNKELSDVLIDKIVEILNKYYTPKFFDKNVKYKRIFGKRSIDYGDFDIIFYSETTKELFLIESKYFSDSFNSSGIVNDYKKMFEPEGYYDHCRRRYDLVLAEPERIKSFIGTDENISVHLLFITSKPIEMELQDSDKIVTFLSLNIFENYIKGNLISGEDDSIIRPTKTI